MTDVATYKKMHPYGQISKYRLKDDMGAQEMALDRPSDEKTLFMLPPKIHGYDLREKKWGKS